MSSRDLRSVEIPAICLSSLHHFLFSSSVPVLSLNSQCEESEKGPRGRVSQGVGVRVCRSWSQILCLGGARDSKVLPLWAARQAALEPTTAQHK